jgi:hypothetical protein
MKRKLPMKTILRIIIILLAAAVVAGTLTAVVNNTSLASSSGEGGQPPAIASANGQSQRPARPEGGDHAGGASLAGGLLQILASLAKLTGITALVLFVEKGVSLLGKRAPQPTGA